MFVSTDLIPQIDQSLPPFSPSLPRVPEKWDFNGLFLEDDQKRRKDFGERLWMAAFGGAALIAPMHIMTLHPSKVTSLVTTSVFVTVVGVVLAKFMTDATPKDIIGATAAYAAVLVVFVGASS
jgi:hypothetical protein